MKKLTGREIIRMYLDFFCERGHTEVDSAPLIPMNDPTVLWINAGVTPLKKYFDGTVVPSNRRLTSCQKCIRTGDIEEVGKTARHHTFFQMLGNFSIGDYFRDEALTWAWELLTSPKYFDMDKDKLYITVYTDDVDSYNKWISLGVKPSHLVKLDGNFWEIGPGPSGPDTEIFYDRGEKYDKEGKGIKLLQEEIENDRYIEIWNNVLSQFNATEGLKREEYPELPSKNIDTGMGVERMACIMQGTETNYETDLFMPIMKKIEEICSIPYMGQMEFKVIADHIRTLTFALSDGAVFENVGRGYVLRRLLRRASRMGKKLNINREFLSDMVDVVVENYKDTYPDLVGTKSKVKELIAKEERLFQKTLLAGEKRLEELFDSGTKVISGEDAFKLYDTYGFPIELTVELASELNIKVDVEGFKEKFKAHQELSRQGARGKFKGGLASTGEMEVKYHTATHLLNAALKIVVDKDVHQKGSNITSERMRFDFSCDHKLTPEEKEKTENLVNKWIKEGLPVTKTEMTKEEAIKSGAECMFIEKYPDIVTVYNIGDVSSELCGGPHVKNTNELGTFKIKKEEASSAGVRRIKAVLE